MSVDPEQEIIVTNGAMNALHVIMTALLERGDEVLLISPCYFFGGLVAIAGGRPVYVEMDEKQGYALDFDKIRKHISRRTKPMIISSPANPTAYVYSWRDIEQFAEIAEANDLLLVSDESYDRMVYDGVEHTSPLHISDIRDRTILVKSFAKSYALPNWRVGYIVAGAPFCRFFRRVLEWTVFHCPYVNQIAALAALEGPQDWLIQVVRDFENRRNQLLRGIRNLRTLSCVTPQGGPFIFLNHSMFPKETSDELSRRFLEHYGIPALPAKFFHTTEHVRIPFGGTEAAVEKLIAALIAAEAQAPVSSFS
jgi:aspartate/methionine/tyrosine aminotransferase